MRQKLRVLHLPRSLGAPGAMVAVIVNRTDPAAEAGKFLYQESYRRCTTANVWVKFFDEQRGWTRSANSLTGPFILE